MTHNARLSFILCFNLHLLWWVLCSLKHKKWRCTIQTLQFSFHSRKCTSKYCTNWAMPPWWSRFFSWGNFPLGGKKGIGSLGVKSAKRFGGKQYVIMITNFFSYYSEKQQPWSTQKGIFASFLKLQQSLHFLMEYKSNAVAYMPF